MRSRSSIGAPDPRGRVRLQDPGSPPRSEGPPRWSSAAAPGVARRPGGAWRELGPCLGVAGVLLLQVACQAPQVVEDPAPIPPPGVASTPVPYQQRGPEMAESMCAPPPIQGPGAVEVAPLVEAERRFCLDVVNEGMRDGFLGHFDDEGVLYRPGPVPAVAWLKARAPSPITLAWHPELAAISADGDLGFTSGPWKAYGPGEIEPAATGTYLTVWGRAADGSYKVLIDHGISHPPRELIDGDQTVEEVEGGVEVAEPPVASTAAVVLALPVADPAPPPVVTAEDLKTRATDFRGEVEALGAEAYAARLLEGGWLLREGAPPMAEAGDHLPPTKVWTWAGARIASSGDLGYLWGTLADEPGAFTHGIIQVWQHQGDGEWGLLTEILTPWPQP